MNAKKPSKISIHWSILLLLISVISLQTYILVTRESTIPGRIIYRREGRLINTFELVLMDGEGNRSQLLGNFTGSPTWSHDGKYIATGCEDITKICILDPLTIPNGRIYPHGNLRLSPEIVTEVELPEACLDVNLPSWGVNSISWSPSGKELAVVCKSVQRQEVCILTIDGDSRCLGALKDSGISRIAWSPTSINQLAISTRNTGISKIYLVDQNGENREFLVDGEDPEWSSDGQEIAFIRWQDSTQNGWQGISVINIVGSDVRWIYEPWETSIDPVEYIFFNCSDPGFECRLDWSPDNHYLVFSGNYIGLYISYIFRMDTDSGDIVFLTGMSQGYQANGEPSWGP